MNKCQWVYQVRKKRLTNGSCLNQIFHKPSLKLNSSNKSIEGQKYGTKTFSVIDNGYQ